jgi:hypothetical protein
MPRFDEFGEDSVEELELAAAPKDVILHIFWVEIIKEEVWVIADLPELHDSIT